MPTSGEGPLLPSRHKDKLAATKAEFLTMEQQGIVRLSKSSWASPLHMVKKKDGT